jgi:hypothetical protein
MQTTIKKNKIMAAVNFTYTRGLLQIRHIPKENDFKFAHFIYSTIRYANQLDLTRCLDLPESTLGKNNNPSRTKGRTLGGLKG